jgi:hypothetical protein
MHTNLGADALNTMEGYKELCTDGEFETFENGIIGFDIALTGFGYPAIEAKHKLINIRDLDFDGFTAVMYVYFGKLPSEYLDKAL